MNELTMKNYASRFERVLTYIEEHLDDALNVDVLSQIACFSKFHFHRQFSQYVGMGVGAYVRRLRLRRAANQLVFSDLRIIDIAFDAGFESPEAFARAFRQIGGQSPSAFRISPQWRPWTERLRLPPKKRTEEMNVKIVEFTETPIAILEHRGAPELVNDSVLTFIEWRKQSGLSPVKTSRTFGIAYDDPDATPAEDFRFDIGGEVIEPVPTNSQGVENRMIPGGRCAVVHHLGSLDRIAESIYPFYREWLPQSGEELRDFPMFFHYLNLPPDVPDHELMTDIYFPLK
ncbi:AraC family transcriptional regulator [Pontiellaceae bacterium B1224]|nr:AraC family transcriptional regulator [Pontiellaceae bacterium B1224]